MDKRGDKSKIHTAISVQEPVGEGGEKTTKGECADCRNCKMDWEW